jgi:hypothetical protein
MTAAAETVVEGRYLGYPIRVTDTTIMVYRPDGRFISFARSFPEARRIVRGHRGGQR